MKHWVFDLDGTLVDTFGLYFKALEDIFATYGARFTSDLRMPALTESLPLFFRAHLGAAAMEPAMERLQTVSNADAAKVRPFPGVDAFIAELKRRGSKVAVWTNRDYVSAELILRQTGLHQYLDAFVSGTCTLLRKPHAEGLTRIVGEFACRPRDITMVGDHEHDVLAAKSIGARGVRASWHGYWKVDPCATADIQFHDWMGFRDWAVRAPA